MDKFNLENQWQEYLQLVNLKEEELPEDQRRETRRAFFGGVGNILMTLKNDLSKLQEDEAIEKLEDMIDQVRKFWSKEINS